MPYARPDATLPTDPAFVYHATNEERAAFIASEGLKPHKPWEFTEQDAWPDGGVEKRVYFSPKADNIWQFAPEEGRAVALRVPRSVLKLGKDGTGDLFVRTRVPAKYIEALLADGRWVPLSRQNGLEGIVTGSSIFRGRS